MKTLLIGQIHADAHALLAANTNLQTLSQAQFDQIKPLDVHAIVLRTFTPLQKKQLDLLAHLQYVISCSVGTDNIDLEELQRRNITLIHCPGTNANSVAEHALYLLYSVLREDPNQPYAELKNKTVGLLGFGYIGKLVAQKLRGCDCNIIAFDVIEQDQKVLRDLHVTMKSFEDVLSQSDIISIHVPYNKHTEKLISNKAFELIKPKSFFINTSRAEVIDEDAFLHHATKFRGIGLDVYSDHLKDKLLQSACKNLIFTPHVAAQGEDSFREQCMKPIEEFIKKIKS